MEIMIPAIQVVVAFGIANVWLLRVGSDTAWRGGEATTLQEEFAVYGLPVWFMRVVGALKLTCATLLLVGLWVPEVTRWAALGLVALMLGAIAMHFKVRDPLLKSVPAIAMLTMSGVIAATAG